jgi:hypothetical protein
MRLLYHRNRLRHLIQGKVVPPSLLDLTATGSRESFALETTGFSRYMRPA